MREYRKRKRLGQGFAPAFLPSPCSVVRAPGPLSLSRQTGERSIPQPASPQSGFVRKAVPSNFKTALQLARTFPFRVLASRVCPYCYNTGYSSPGTRVQLLSQWEKIG